MGKKYDYKIFPETWKARVVVVLALVLGFMLVVAYYVSLFTFIADVGFPWNPWGKIEVSYVNETDERVLVYIDERLAHTVDPHETVVDSDLKVEWWFDRDIVVRDDGGNIILATELDRDDLKDRDYRIVIDD